MASIYENTRAELVELLHGEPSYRVDQVWHGLWSEGQELGAITTIPKALRARLTARFSPSLEVLHDVQSDHGATRKWVFRLHDGSTIETVLMSYEDRVTVCVSSQAGCAMGCTFCATGQAGFTRHLSAGEVLEQVMFAARAAAPRRLSNVVFMGMGEPLANYAVTVNVVKRLHEYRGLSARHLTVSTVGVAPAIERLAKEGLPLTLAVSLHAANNATRDELVPLNRRYPLERLRRGVRILDRDHVASSELRVGPHRRGERHRPGDRRAGALRRAAARARQPDPAQSDAGLSGARVLDASGCVDFAKASRPGASTSRCATPGDAPSTPRADSSRT